MTNYEVRWTINESAVSPREAAEAVRARYFQLTGACVFEVLNTDDANTAKWVQVDLARSPSEDSFTWDYDHRTLAKMAKQLIKDGGDETAVLEMLEKPWKWPELLTEAMLDAAYDDVSPFPEEEDLLEDPVAEE